MYNNIVTPKRCINQFAALGPAANNASIRACAPPSCNEKRLLLHCFSRNYNTRVHVIIYVMYTGWFIKYMLTPIFPLILKLLKFQYLEYLCMLKDYILKFIRLFVLPKEINVGIPNFWFFFFLNGNFFYRKWSSR